MRNQRDSCQCLESTVDVVKRLQRAAEDAAWEGKDILARELLKRYEHHRRRLLAGETLTPRF
jgi:phage shock protein A